METKIRKSMWRVLSLHLRNIPINKFIYLLNHFTLHLNRPGLKCCYSETLSLHHNNNLLPIKSEHYLQTRVKLAQWKEEKSHSRQIESINSSVHPYPPINRLTPSAAQPIFSLHHPMTGDGRTSDWWCSRKTTTTCLCRKFDPIIRIVVLVE